MDFTNIMRIVNTSLLTSRLSTIDEEGSRLSESSDICEFKILKILHETCSNYYFFIVFFQILFEFPSKNFRKIPGGGAWDGTLSGPERASYKRYGDDIKTGWIPR